MSYEKISYEDGDVLQGKPGWRPSEKQKSDVIAFSIWHLAFCTSHLALMSHLASRIFYLTSRIFYSSYGSFLSRISHFLSCNSYFLSRRSHFYLELSLDFLKPSKLSRISHVSCRLPCVCENKIPQSMHTTRHSK